MLIVMPTERPTVHYVVSTHWDREWYEPFQHYRWRLVRLLDRVVEGIAAGQMDGPFTCDGQAIILEDYLEIRPERRAEIEQLVRAGKLVVGPWYVLPDEFLVSGETMIRNIELGRQIARDFGGTPSSAGFVCDLFGHVSQLPQILAGFSVTGTLVWRGIELDREMCGFSWKGADGTTLPSYRFGCDGYCDFAVKGRGLWTRQPPTLKQLSTFAKAEMDRANIGAALIFDGADHIEWDPAVSKLIREHNALPDRTCDIVHSTLDAFLTDLAKRSSRFSQTIEGELRMAASRMHDEDHSWLIPGVLSSRVWIKQQNDECTALLTHWAEPMALLAGGLLESAYPSGFLQTAWKYLLKNHPHDSICGCSIDAVHQDVEYRFRQSKQIAERLRRESCRDIVGAISPRVEDKAVRFAVFNPSTEARDEVVVTTLSIPTDWPKFNEFFGFEPKPAFVIEDANGKEVPYQRLDQSMNRNKFRTFAWQFPQGYKTDDVTIAFEASMPAMGYTSFTVRPVEGKPTRYPVVPSLATSERSLENERLRVHVAPDGTITLTDKRTKQTYERLLSYEDTADIGDGWYHGPAVNDERISSVGSAVRVSLVHDTPLIATLRLRTTLELPAEFDFSMMRRSERTIPLVIETDLTLTRNAAHLDAATRIVNNVCDHRLRVLLPTSADTQTYIADSAFDVVERAIALNDRNHEYRELEVETKPQHSFTAVSDAKRGLAVVATGLKESAVRDLPDRPIALTLYRSTRRTVMTDGEPDGQMLGRSLVFRWRIVPIGAGGPDVAALSRMGQQLSAGLHVEQVTPADLPSIAPTRETPAEASLMSVGGDCVVTSLRQVRGKVELRAFNPLRRAGKLVLRPGTLQFGLAQPTDFEGKPIGDVHLANGGGITIDVGPKKIVTLQLS